MFYYYLLHRRYNKDSTRSTCALGFFSSKKKILEAIEYYKELDGFKEYPDGFEIEKMILDYDDFDFIIEE